MMEKVDRSGQEDFIWAMNIQNQLADNTNISWKYRKSLIQSDMHDSSETAKESDKIKRLAMFVPKEIIFDSENLAQRDYYTCILMGRISGLQELNSLYLELGRDLKTISHLFNAYIGSIFQEIICYGGDVVNFTGTQFIAMWKISEDADIYEVIHQALDSAFIIQKLYGDYPSDTGIYLEVKMMVSVGDVTFGIFGNQSVKKCLLFGEPITEIMNTMDTVKSNEIIAAFSAWKHINPDDYNFSVTESGCIKVTDFSQNWKNSKNAFLREYIKKEALEKDALNFRPLNIMLKSSKTSFVSLKSEDGSTVDFYNEDHLPLSCSQHPLFAYPLPPVRNCIQANEDFSVLTERRINVCVTIRAQIKPNIDVINLVYKDVFKIVLIMDGIVKNLFFFAENLIITIVFGLRGFSHEHESQRGLKCATYCLKALKQCHEVQDCSIVVSTDLAYNGILGTASRKDFIILSRKLTKSIKLSHLITNKIICDRETFVHSKLDAQNFIILAPTTETAHFGTIYEYDEQFGLSSIGKPYKKIFPILDRDYELNKFLEILDAKMQGETDGKKVLVILGLTRQGKSRLSEEFMYNTPCTLPTFRLELVQCDKTIPYQTIYKLFSIPLGFNEHTSHYDRKAKLVSKLRHVPVPQLSCALNKVFKVNFELTKTYSLLSKEQQNIAISKILNQLAHLCFRKLWIIIIDNGEFIDIESWPLLGDLINTQSILMTITISIDKPISTPAKTFLNQLYVEVLQLKPMRQYYQIGLACQLLEVIGVPRELEKLLHEKSNGSPGWIENFLRTMMTDNCLKIINVTTKELKDYDLAVVPLEMINRNPVAKEYLGSSGYTTITGRLIALNEKWAIYKNTFIDSKKMYDTNFQEMKKPKATGWIKVSTLTLEDFNVESNSSLSSDSSEKIKGITKRICLIENMERLRHIGGEMGLTSFMVKLFDSLNFLQQQILQCSSVIGYRLTREMLRYLTSFPNEDDLSTAIKKLFELGVFDCAAKQYYDGNIGYIVDPPKLNTIEPENLICYCIGHKLVNPDFPKYALCENMYFKIHMIRERTYDLIPLSDRKIYHYRSIQFLEKYTRKCRRCGQGFFSNIHKFSNARKVIYNYLQLSPKKLDTYRDSESQGTDKTYFMPYSSSNINLEQLNTKHVGLDSKKATESWEGDLRLTIVQNFIDMDFFEDCKCHKILAETYTQVTEHALAIEYMIKWTLTTLEHAQLSISLHNIPLALNLLDRALIILEEKPMKIMQSKESWNIPYIKGKIYTLIGTAQYELGETKEAYRKFETALKYFNFKLPKKTSMCHTIATLQQRIMLTCCSRFGVNNKEGYIAEYSDDVSKCLSRMCQLFIDLDLIENAEIAALWSLKKALESEKDISVLIIAFTNMIKVLILKKKLKFVKTLEERALAYCKSHQTKIFTLDLWVIAALYTIVYEARVVECNFDDANKIGDMAFKLQKKLPLKHKSLEIFTVYFHSLLIKKNIVGAANLIAELKDLDATEEYFDLSWYYALCLCFHLETGYSVLAKKSNSYFLETNYSIHDITAKKRYQVCLWLWYLRLQEYGSADKWKLQLRQTWSISKNDPVANLITAMYYLECLLLDYARAIETKEFSELDERLAEIKKISSLLSSYTSYQKLLLPRFYLLKAFLHCLQDDCEKGFACLKYGYKVAKKTKNLFDEGWINHNQMVWKNNMPSINVYFWKEQTRKLSILESALEMHDFTIAYYSFELPGFM